MNGDGTEPEPRTDETQTDGARHLDARGVEPQDVDAVTLPWSERGEREFKDMFASGTIALLLAMSVVGFANAVRSVPGPQLGSGLFALALAVVAVLSWYGPFGSVGARVSVDHRGLWIRHQGWSLGPGGTRIELMIPRHLPASEIGQVETVSENGRRKMWSKSMALRYEGKRLGWTRTTVDKETVDAVLIEQLDPGLRRPWWLVKCRQHDELVRALELARSDHQRHG